MRDETTRYLDGERALAELGPAARDEVEAWERLVRSLREDVPGPAPAWLEGAVMAEIAAAPRRSAGAGPVAWLLRPSLRVSPLGVGLAAAAVVAALLLVGRDEMPTPGATATTAAALPAPQVAAVIYVQFTLEAPTARSVSVAGDFNGWDAGQPLEDADGDGVWTGRVPIEPGVHQYMFIVDGTDWVTDPRAGRWSDDGFGHRNAVLAVAPAGAV